METGLSAQAVAEVIVVRTEVRRKIEEARRLRDATFSAGMLTGTGFEAWTSLWEAARRFSEESAYPSQAFPLVEGEAHCVLCQQGFDHAAKHRMIQFEAFVASTTERELRQLRDAYSQHKKTLTDLLIISESIEDALREIRIEDEAFADAISAVLAINEDRRKAIVRALTEDKDLPADCPDLASIAHKVDALSNQIESRVRTLRADTADETRKRMTAEARELNARKQLAKHEQVILDDIERRKKHAAYGLCIEETRTQTITQKSTVVTKMAVSENSKGALKMNWTISPFVMSKLSYRKPEGRTAFFITN
jgi:hypothetical protein